MRIFRQCLGSIREQFQRHLLSDKAELETGWLIMGTGEGDEATVCTAIPPGPKAVALRTQITFDAEWQVEQALKLPAEYFPLGSIHSHPIHDKRMSALDLVQHSDWVEKFGTGLFGLIFPDLDVRFYVLEPGMKAYRQVEMVEI